MTPAEPVAGIVVGSPEAGSGGALDSLGSSVGVSVGVSVGLGVLVDPAGSVAVPSPSSDPQAVRPAASAR